MRAVQWEIDETTSVKIKRDETGRDEIWLSQGDHCIIFSDTGASVLYAVEALMSAIRATECDWPDLAKFGFVSEDA